MAEAPREELETLSKRLEDRLSILHFAWSFGLGCVAFMGIGVALKLFHDSIRTPKAAYGLLGVGICCAVLGLVRLTRGLRLYRTELREYRRFLALRTELGLDRPQLPAA